MSKWFYSSHVLTKACLNKELKNSYFSFCYFHVRLKKIIHYFVSGPSIVLLLVSPLRKILHKDLGRMGLSIFGGVFLTLPNIYNEAFYVKKITAT